MAEPYFPEYPFRNSRPVDPSLLREAGCFTTFGARINTRDDLAESGMVRAVDDFAKATNSARSQNGGATTSPVGTLASLIYHDCLPDRMEIMSYFVEVGFLHDDATEPETTDAVFEAHRRLDYALDPNATESPDGLPMSAIMKKIYSVAVLECMDIDPLPSLDMIKFYSQWLKEADTKPMPVTTLDDYIRHRDEDSGTFIFWWMVIFGHGDRMTEDEHSMMGPLFHVARTLFLLINDFYSWPGERALPIHRIRNAVLLYMKSESMPEQEAIARVKKATLEEEARFLTVRDALAKAHPDLPPHLKRVVNIVESAIGSYHYWAATCPRYNSWKEHSPLCMETPFVIAQESEPQISESPPDPPLAEQPDATKQCIPSSHDGLPVLDKSALMPPISYIQSLSSKDVRSQLIDAFNLWLQVPSATLDVIKQAINDLHHSSLILDDVQDESLLRRGSTATHIIYGNAQAINSATYMFLQVTKNINDLHHPALTTVLFEELEKLFIGQSYDLNWKYTMSCPSEEEYFAMVDHKTGAMFSMIIRMMLAAGKESPLPANSLEDLARLLGRWYQLRDDYMNLQCGQYAKQKGFCEDFDEGKFSYPIIRCCATNPAAADIILGLFWQKWTHGLEQLPLESKMQLLGLMEGMGAFQEAWDLMLKFQREIEEEVGRLEGLFNEPNPVLRLLMKVLADVPEPGKRDGCPS